MSFALTLTSLSSFCIFYPSFVICSQTAITAERIPPPDEAMTTTTTSSKTASATAPDQPTDDDEKNSGGTKTLTAASVKYFMRELVYGKAYRRFRLPTDADTEHASANLENGVLTVRLNRKPPQERSIEIQ